MPKIEMKYVFDDLEDFQRYMDGFETKAPTTEVATATLAVAEAARTVADAPVAEPTITDNVDKDGLPYDPEIHATPKSQTADGLWRAKRGKADEANAARDAFKAAGGAVVAPVVTAMPGMPGATAPVTAPRAAEPISYDKLIDKTVGMMQRSKIDADGVMKLYGEVGIIDPASLETNESQRAALFGKLCEIEPELH